MTRSPRSCVAENPDSERTLVGARSRVPLNRRAPETVNAQGNHIFLIGKWNDPIDGERH
jgi:hypothetical protein